MKSSRKIKIQPRCVFRKYDRTMVPELILKGKWLAELGFSAGQEVNVEINEEKLVITRKS